MDSLTVYHLARELDARWRGRIVRAGHLDRAAKRVVIGVLQVTAIEIDLSIPEVVVRVVENAREAGRSRDGSSNR